MDQFVLIPRTLYEQKLSLSPKNLDKDDLVPTSSEIVNKRVNAKTKSFSKESFINKLLNSPRMKLSLADSILLDERDTNAAFVDFVLASKKKTLLYLIFIT